MTIQEAQKLLEGTVRYELRDHAFGDREVTWAKDNCEIATGYFSGSCSEVYYNGEVFNGADAIAILKYGTLTIERNDETGPDEYVDGKVMEGLTLKGVLEEITLVRRRPRDLSRRPRGETR
jgi:hypothetical protein